MGSTITQKNPKAKAKISWFNTIRWIWPLLLLALVLSIRPWEQKNSVGHALYKQHCLNCHFEDGQGLGTLIPPLANSDYLTQHFKELPCQIRYGIKDTILVNGISYNQPMPGNKILSDVEIFNLVAYMQQQFKVPHPPMNIKEIESLLQECKP